MDSKSDDIREFRNALVTIKGNSLRCQRSIFAIHNIVSLTFDSIRRERERPSSIDNRFGCAKKLFKYFLYCLAVFILLWISEEINLFEIDSIKDWTVDNFDISSDEFKKYFTFFFLSIPGSFLLSIIMFIIAILTKWCYLTNRYYYTHGLRIVFVNNLTLFLVSRAETGFVEETIRYLELFISNPEYSRKRELVINFSDRSVNIKKADNSNIIGGNVEGNVTNG